MRLPTQAARVKIHHMYLDALVSFDQLLIIFIAQDSIFAVDADATDGLKGQADSHISEAL
jgi:hypothetical protein